MGQRLRRGGAWSEPEQHADDLVPLAEFFEIVLSCGVELWAFRRLDRLVFCQASTGLCGSRKNRGYR